MPLLKSISQMSTNDHEYFVFQLFSFILERQLKEICETSQSVCETSQLISGPLVGSEVPRQGDRRRLWYKCTFVQRLDSV